MEDMPKEKLKKKESKPKITTVPSTLKPIKNESIVFSMTPEQEIILLKDLLGNFSDQTGARFG